MRSQNIKYNPSGKVVGVSCLSLLLLTFLVINPFARASAFAEETMDADEAGIPVTQADIPSTVEISFSPTSGSASLSPSTPTGQSAQINVLARVDVQNSGGYTVYLKSNSQNLVGQKDNNHIIPGATVAKTYNAMDVNTWGYYAGEGSSVPEGATYKAISVSGNGDKVAENSNTKIKTDTKNIMLSFAAKINDEKPADTYQNTVTMSVVSSPLQTTLTDIANMQDMTTNICKASATYETKQLKDIRDGKYYWVTKLADNKCWMTQNLDLDLSTTKKLTAADSDVTTDYIPTYDTAVTVDENTVLNDNVGQRSWNLGNVRIANPDEPNDCGYPKNSATDCKEQFTDYSTPTSMNGEEDAHYILGNHYQWNAATAGTGEAITSGQAESSICAQGWRLPTSNTGGEFEKLVATLGGTSSTDNITKAPFYGVRGGYVAQTPAAFSSAGSFGFYESSTPYPDDASAVYDLRFLGTTTVEPSRTVVNNRRSGYSVRCIAR